MASPMSMYPSVDVTLQVEETEELLLNSESEESPRVFDLGFPKPASDYRAATQSLLS